MAYFPWVLFIGNKMWMCVNYFPLQLLFYIMFLCDNIEIWGIWTKTITFSNILYVSMEIRCSKRFFRTTLEFLPCWMSSVCCRATCQTRRSWRSWTARLRTIHISRAGAWRRTSLTGRWLTMLSDWSTMLEMWVIVGVTSYKYWAEKVLIEKCNTSVQNLLKRPVNEAL